MRSLSSRGPATRLLLAGLCGGLVLPLTTVLPATAQATPDPTAAPDRYDLANGCWAIQSPLTGYVVRDGSVFAATGPDLASAEPFFLEPTELGVYLLFASAEDFLVQSGSGTSIAGTPSANAEWIVESHTSGGFALHEFTTGSGLGVDEAGTLVETSAGNSGGPDRQFLITPHTGCAEYPEITTNVTGTPYAGSTTTTEVVGYADAHLHHMGFEFLGGSAHCGRPWHRYGVAFALVDCPDHGADGSGAILENFLRNGTPVGNHDPVGWPTFADWPAPDSLTHEQTYYQWMKRAWQGGLRMYVMLNVENAALCELYPIKRNGCNEMDSVRQQLQDIHDLENYVDAQSGGPGEGWLRIVTDPYQAREVMNDGKLAVILGIEISALFDCRLISGMAQCDEAVIDEQLQEMWDAGVRQMEITNKFDNALSGVAGDSGSLGYVVNAGQFEQSGRFWDMRTCEIPEGVAEEDFHDHDKNQDAYFSDVPEQDAIFGAVNDIYGPGAVAPIYPAGPHCNALGLSDLGAYAIEGMMEHGVIIDPDHMSVLARQQALDLIDAAGYEGVISSHSWSTPIAYQRILEMGGMLAAIPGAGTNGFLSDYRDAKTWQDDRYYFGFGYGADNNGFANQPRAVAELLGDNPVTYPFTGLGGVVIDQQVSGERVYDVNVDGVAHYGLYPDWWEALARLGGEELRTDMQRSSEAFLQTWERAWGLRGDACRTDVPDLTRAEVDALLPGTFWIDVLEAVGQPNRRYEQYYSYCIEGGTTVTLEFDANDRLIGGNAPAGPGPVLGGEVDPAPGQLPATGGGAAAGALFTLAAAAAATARRRRFR